MAADGEQADLRQRHPLGLPAAPVALVHARLMPSSSTAAEARTSRARVSRCSLRSGLRLCGIVMLPTTPGRRSARAARRSRAAAARRPRCRSARACRSPSPARRRPRRSGRGRSATRCPGRPSPARRRTGDARPAGRSVRGQASRRRRRAGRPASAAHPRRAGRGAARISSAHDAAFQPKVIGAAGLAVRAAGHQRCRGGAPPARARLLERDAGRARTSASTVPQGQRRPGVGEVLHGRADVHVRVHARRAARRASARISPSVLCPVSRVLGRDDVEVEQVGLRARGDRLRGRRRHEALGGLRPGQRGQHVQPAPAAGRAPRRRRAPPGCPRGGRTSRVRDPGAS